MVVTTFTAYNKYSGLNRDNLKQPIQMQLYHKQKNISEYFSALWKTSLKFEHFQKKDDLHSQRISQITHSQRVG